MTHSLYDTPSPLVDTHNKPLVIRPQVHPDDHPVLSTLKSIVSKGYNVQSGTALIACLQQQRSTVLEILMEAFRRKPTPGMTEAIGAIMNQLEKSVRDDRKEALKSKELETTQEMFELFSRSLNEVISGNVVLPTFGQEAFNLTPTQSFTGEDEQFAEDELQMGIEIIDIKPIEKKLAEIDAAAEGSGAL